MDLQDDDAIINTLLNSNNLKNIINNLVKTESKGQKKDSAIHKISELLNQSNLTDVNTVTSTKNASTIPINDLKSDNKHYSDEEVQIRCSLASLFRLIDLEGWTRTIYNLISLRFSSNPNTFLVNPFGLLNHEVTASSLIKINDNGSTLDAGCTILKLNKSAWKMHQAIYAARPDLNCIVQVNLPDVVAISSIKTGLLPISIEATKLSDHLLTGDGVKYHNLTVASRDPNYESLIGDLGKSKVMFLRNTGLLVCGETVPETWLLVKTAVVACQNQIRLSQLCGKNSLNEAAEDGDASFTNGNNSTDYRMESEVEFEAMMRLLDNSGYRTGHKYSNNVIMKRRKVVPTAVDVMEEENETPVCVEKQMTNNNDEPMFKGEECGDATKLNGKCEDEIDGLIQICPMPPVPNENGDVLTHVDENIHYQEHEQDEHKEDNVQVNNEEETDKDDQSMKEHELVKEICAEVIDNSIKYLEQNPVENHD